MEGMSSHAIGTKFTKFCWTKTEGGSGSFKNTYENKVEIWLKIPNKMQSSQWCLSGFLHFRIQPDLLQRGCFPWTPLAAESSSNWAQINLWGSPNFWGDAVVNTGRLYWKIGTHYWRNQDQKNKRTHRMDTVERKEGELLHWI